MSGYNGGDYLEADFHNHLNISQGNAKAGCLQTNIQDDIKMIRALIFDFDGLILETEEPVFQSWHELYESFGCHLPFDRWSKQIGTMDSQYDPLAELEKQLGRALQNREELAKKRLRRELDLIYTTPVQPGVKEYLEAAKRLGLKIGLASSSSCQWVTDHLSRLGLIGYFDCIKAADDVERVKPDPRLYFLVLGELQTKADETLAFEDSPPGILAAKRAGLFCVAVPNAMTKNLPLNQADILLNSLAEMPLEALLQKVEAHKTAQNYRNPP